MEVTGDAPIEVRTLRLPAKPRTPAAVGRDGSGRPFSLRRQDVQRRFHAAAGLPHHVGVDLRRPDATVPDKVLHGGNILLAFEQVPGEAVRSTCGVTRLLGRHAAQPQKANFRSILNGNHSLPTADPAGACRRRAEELTISEFLAFVGSGRSLAH